MSFGGASWLVVSVALSGVAVAFGGALPPASSRARSVLFAPTSSSHGDLRLSARHEGPERSRAGLYGRGGDRAPYS
eukprot:9146649-Alexandrium_andersonii.AAC.1